MITPDRFATVLCIHYSLGRLMSWADNATHGHKDMGDKVVQHSDEHDTRYDVLA